MSATKTRKSVPLDPDDLRAVAELREHTTHKAALLHAAGVELSEHPTEAEAMHALIVAGREAIRERIMRDGYAALAAAQTDEDTQIARAASRRKARLAG